MHPQFPSRWSAALWMACLLGLSACGGGDDEAAALAAAAVDDGRETAQAVGSSSPTNGSWVRVALLGQSFKVSGAPLMRFGAGINWSYKLMSAGTLACEPATFAGFAGGTTAQCDVFVPSTVDPWVRVAFDGERFTLAAANRVRYGRDTRWVTKTLTGPVACNTTTFGDPAPGESKRCTIYSTAGSAASVINTASSSVSTTTPSALDIRRLADQATFGVSETTFAQMRTQTPVAWTKAQMALSASRYTSGNGDEIDRNVQAVFFCDRSPYDTMPNCWRDWFSSEPLMWDFYRNALNQPDQLRQRVAFALGQIVVVSAVESDGTYGLREYHNMLLDNAFGNWRQVLKKASVSPMMGEYLNHVNNNKTAPNENFARELLQLFSLGTCDLNADGTLKGGRCTPTYDNQIVREYAFALTGWTYPAGGSASWGCWPLYANCAYRKGDMVAVTQLQDTKERRLLSGITVPASRTPAQALELVLDSLMAHPNMAPFISRQLIQHLVTSNPSAAYVQRVAQAFTDGRYTHAATSTGFGAGVRGDLAATVAAILLDAEARNPNPGVDGGKLRPPVLAMTGILKALNGRSDGTSLGWWWGETFRQHTFRAPSVFNYYPPSYPLPGTALLAPEFGIHNANAALARLNFLTFLLDWGGGAIDTTVPNAVGTKVDMTAFITDAGDAAKLVDRMATVALGEPLPSAARTQVITAVQAFTTTSDPSNWQRNRVNTAAYLIFGSPLYQVQR